MKMFIHSVQNLSCSFAYPLTRAALPLFFVLAFMPSILHLMAFDMKATSLLPALGPVAAGFWFAAGLREIQVSLALLGPSLSALLWMVNWLMLSGHSCCATMN
jgi:hypothetical protein